MRKSLSVDHEQCIGCRICELACSMSQKNTFCPGIAKIKVHLVGIPEVPVPVFSRHCDSCGGKPVCLKYCPVGCISFSEDNPKRDMKNIVISEEVGTDWLERVKSEKPKADADEDKP